VWVGVDASVRHDSSAIVAVTYKDDVVAIRRKAMQSMEKKSSTSSEHEHSALPEIRSQHELGFA
jgi:hypothetical protein